MASATWAEILGQAVLHGLVASLFVEALVRGWRAAEPNQRMALRLTALGYPLVVFPALVFLFPERTGDDFRETWALFVGRSWDDLAVLGIGLLDVWVVAFGLAGALLFGMDLLPVLKRRGRSLASDPLDERSAAAVDAALPFVLAALQLRKPPVVFLDRDAPVLFCTGVRRPSIVISRGAIALLDREELRAALAHELAHVAARDPLKSWILMGARLLMFWNPAFQVLSRAIARDAEWLADERAAIACNDRLALASGLLKLHRAGLPGRSLVPRTLPFAGALAEPLERVRSHDIEVRCRRLLDGAPRPLPFGKARVALAGASVTALLFFVV